jgi:hypothetical protein
MGVFPGRSPGSIPGSSTENTQCQRLEQGGIAAG